MNIKYFFILMKYHNKLNHKQYNHKQLLIKQSNINILTFNKFIHF